VLKELLQFVVDVIVYSAVISLIVALPVRWAASRIVKQSLGYWRAYLYTFLVDGLGHLLPVAAYFCLGRFRPPITNQPLIWIENILVIFVVAMLAGCVLLLKGGRPSWARNAINSLMVVAIIMAKDVVFYLVVVYFIIRPAVPGS
jgi:hypothetical protein